MESLEDLPLDDRTKNAPLSPEGKAKIKNFVGAAPKSKSHSSASGEDSKWKIIGYIAIAFLALANPWINGLLSKLPYVGGNNITEFLTATVIFIITVIIIEFYA